MSKPRVLFTRPKEYYEMMGWYKLGRDLVTALFRGVSGFPILVLVAVNDAARWLCGGEEPCILLASIDYPHNVRDFIVNNRVCCDSTIRVPDEFINGLNILYGVDLNPNLCKAHIEKPLEYVDDVSLLLQVNKLVSDPEYGFGLTFIHP